MMLIIHLYHLIKYTDNIPICTIGTIFGWHDLLKRRSVESDNQRWRSGQGYLTLLSTTSILNLKQLKIYAFPGYKRSSAIRPLFFGTYHET